MVEPERLRDNIERWLIHENYKFDHVKDPESSFKINLKHTGTFGVPVEIFHPIKQPNVVVLGGKVALKNHQNARYLKLNQKERENFHKKIGDYCYSIKAIHKILEENGKKIVGVYVVLDNESLFNQQDFVGSLQQVVEMSEKTIQFLMKTF